MRKKTVCAETYAGDCRILGSFDRFFTAYGCVGKSVSEDVVNAWIQSLFASNARKTVADTVGYLRNFLKYLQYCAAMELTQDCNAFLFPGQLPGEHLKRDTVSHCFLTILKATGIYQEPQSHTRGQCLHNLRHLFAIKSFAQAEQAGRSAENSIPYLSVFLGHYDMDGTEKYLKFSSDIFPEYTALFEDYAASVFPEVAYET